ncbi:MAG: penicillin acylase family protein [Flavobacteriales bacterium]|nr:penicillin acylase family protein [Flavobacteriales bacterium]
MIKHPGKAKIQRIHGEIPMINAASEEDFYFGLGYMHAIDRGMQLMFMKILGKGLGSQYLQSSDDMLQIDIFFRRMGWHLNTKSELEKLDEKDLSLIQKYCDGINAAYKKYKPWELKLLLGFKDFHWTPEDTIVLIRMTGYLTLAQSQGEIERFFLHLVRLDVGSDLLKELFPNILDEFDSELIKQIKIVNPIIPDEVKWMNALSPTMASNNWVIGNQKTKGAGAILANDPHLEINRLPNVWYEISGTTGESAFHGATMPGIPSIILGRNEHLSWGVTYSFMDAIDSWIEDCKGTEYRSKESWKKFQKREEVIKRKKKNDHIQVFYDNERGTLEGNPEVDGDGFYLSTKWSGSNSGALTLKAGFQISRSKSVEEGMKTAENIEAAFSWIFADKDQNIGFQMSGLMPIRSGKGFTPQKGWEDKNWEGYHPGHKLPRIYNPPENFIITANNDLNHLGEVKPINMPMASYRADRIHDLISNRNDHNPELSKEIQYDLESVQAKKFMKIIKPLLGDTKAHKVLKNWDYKYNKESVGAYVFEQIYQQLYVETFGNILDPKLVTLIGNDTGIFADFYTNFDLILLSEKSAWFGSMSQEDIYRAAIKKATQKELKTWGEYNSITLKNILLGDSLPSWLGFNKGPIPLEGGRATIHQGQVYRSANRTSSFGPSFRIVTDMATNAIETNYIGGVSDRRFSSNYTNDVKNWQNKEFRKYIINSGKDT